MSDVDRIFISYHHSQEDRTWLTLIRDELARQLGGRATVWCDEELVGGDAWLEHIRKEIDRASVGLFLASDGFFESPFIGLEELGPLMRKLEDGAVSEEGQLRLLFVPIGEEFAARYEAGGWALQTVLPPDDPLPSDPSSASAEEQRAAVEQVVRGVQRALDKTWVDLEDASDRYIIKRRIKHKRWTRTYEATVRGGFEQDVVIKTVSRDHGRWDFYTALEKVRAVTEEANIVGLLEADFEQSPPYYYVMSHVRGGSLLTYVEEMEWLPWDTVQLILCKTGWAVEAARSHGGMGDFVFDIKPSHVMVDKGSAERIEPFLSFIGRATHVRGTKLLEQLEAAYETESELEESYAYLLPEQFIHFGRSVTPVESDVYLLGLMAHHLLTGRYPKKVDTDELRTASAERDTDAIARIFEVEPLLENPEESEWEDEDFFRAVVDKMLAFHPDHRFANCEEALRALAAPRMYASQQVRRSFNRCVRVEEFFARFYEEFFAACGDARALFGELSEVSPSEEGWSRHKKKLKEAGIHLFAYFERKIDRRSGSQPDRRVNTPLDYLATNHKATLSERGESTGVSVEGPWFDTFVEVLAGVADATDPHNLDHPPDSPVRVMRRNRWLQVVRPGARYLRRHQTGE